MSIVESSQYDIRYSENSDRSFLQLAIQEPKTALSCPACTKQEQALFVNSWMGFCSVNSSLTAIYQDQPIAMGILFLMPYRKVMHQSLLQFVVDSKWRGQGVGSSLLRNLKHLAIKRFSLSYLSLDVYEGTFGNFLQKRGFYEVAKQENFIKAGEGYLARSIMEVDLSKGIGP